MATVADPKPPSARSVARVRTLVVDDSPACLALIFSFLEKAPVLALTGIASDPLEALRHLELHQVDLVLLDVKMPQMDGFEVTRRIRLQHPKIQIVMLSDESCAVTLEECRTHGAHGFVPKSDVAKMLLPMIHQLFELEDSPHWTAQRL